ncbi:TetR/AcrR family transcriptional regulator [Amycolatopsis sp. lyj-23]|uniref:TetR/AcrR family transcriptional regulator n=1 Tax=Amycolatopsis sp. lyj-23 TaxID=2789283 RepID=UPI003979490A
MADVDPPPGRATRRRGHELEQAIYGAVLDELLSVGYAQLTIDRVAQRARTGRATLYRRWPSKRELVADAVADALPPLEERPDTGDVREDLLVCFTRMHGLIEGVGRLAMQAVAAELHSRTDDTLVDLVREQVLGPRLQIVLDVLLRGAARGQIRAEAAVPILARTGPALLFQHLLMFGKPPPAAQVEDIVDRVVLPAAGFVPGSP